MHTYFASSDASSTSTAAVPVRDSKQSRPRIVLVDDEPSILVTWQAILESHGYEAICCGSAQEALAAFDKGCACVITDYHMDDMTGLEVLKAARAVADFPVLLMTAEASPALKQAAMLAGAAGVLNKPVRVRTVIETLEKLLQR